MGISNPSSASTFSVPAWTVNSSPFIPKPNLTFFPTKRILRGCLSRIGLYLFRLARSTLREEVLCLIHSPCHSYLKNWIIFIVNTFVFSGYRMWFSVIMAWGLCCRVNCGMYRATPAMLARLGFVRSCIISVGSAKSAGFAVYSPESDFVVAKSMFCRRFPYRSATEEKARKAKEMTGNPSPKVPSYSLLYHLEKCDSGNAFTWEAFSLAHILF